MISRAERVKVMKMILRHFNVELTDEDDLNSKLNELFRDQHLEVQDPTLGWMVKWFERTKAEEKANKDLELQQREPTPDVDQRDRTNDHLLDNEWRNLMNIHTHEVRLQTPHDERYKRYIEQVTRNKLHGNINPGLSKECAKFRDGHKLRYLYNDDEFILLFEPADESEF